VDLLLAVDRLDLLALSSENFRFRFRLCSDNVDEVWVIPFLALLLGCLDETSPLCCIIVIGLNGSSGWYLSSAGRGNSFNIPFCCWSRSSAFVDADCN